MTHLELVSLFEYFLHADDPFMADLADVQQPGDTPEVHKHTIRLYGLYHAGHHLPGLQGKQVPRQQGDGGF